MDAYNRWALRKKLTICKCHLQVQCEWCTEDNPHSKPIRVWEECKNSPWPKKLTMEQWKKEMEDAPRITEKPLELLFLRHPLV